MTPGEYLALREVPCTALFTHFKYSYQGYYGNCSCLLKLLLVQPSRSYCSRQRL